MRLSCILSRALALTMLLVGAAIILLPFVWMISLSLKPADEIFQQGIHFIPSRFEWSNYLEAVTQVPVGRFLLNGVMVCFGILGLQILIAVPCAYALAQRDFRGKALVMGLVLAGLLVPYHVTAIPVFLGLSKLRLLDSYSALVLPFAASVFGIFLFRQYFATIPRDLMDAARVDGLSEVSIVWRIAFPLAWPAATAFAIFSVVAHWNDLFWPLIAVSDPDLATPPRGILFFRDEEAGSNFGPLMAAATIITAPLILGFLLAQRAFIQGMTMAGIKG
ncbi:carbohydrate ABC transporter permease [Cohaesibacter celericrescens]|uniref:Carbohydrate ABC transporter permease n=1 Tax=Cohaesibacter celericrescens TaxID=2067669 RepID=A0A2N5XVV4_9HYPH|nr:carbohydrate ABC transporter permease [Cohaesibacter celericrescens]PLW78558.1 carbohydrate ABC transporter permease [Cohaesibacter celericrescens]